MMNLYQNLMDKLTKKIKLYNYLSLLDLRIIKINIILYKNNILNLKTLKNK